MLQRLLKLLHLSRAAPQADESAADARKGLGRRGEQIAAEALQRRGLKILKRNYTCTRGEIDIIALDGRVICFIEVKTRRPDAMLPPERNVDTAKRRQVRRVARNYLRKNGLQDRVCRFDIVSVVCPETGEPSLQVFTNAF
ncbi:MAG TPA: YraN family protein [Planctomycetota bacterium]|nr:YraN family protein [Planctomycetota bacterium]